MGIVELYSQHLDYIDVYKRQEHTLPYIFLHQKKGYKVAMLNVEYFIMKINKLIYKYEICDDSGELWNFTSRQCRKTLVVNMIENGATTMELEMCIRDRRKGGCPESSCPGGWL